MEKTQKERAFLLGATFSSKDNIEYSLKELERLAETAGLEVVDKDYQYIREVTPATLFGSGKVEEIAERVKELNINVVIVDHELSGSQTNNLSNYFGVKVIDRITLILDIFAGRATTNEGKLQVELAQLKYNLPRLSGISGTSGRFGSGGVGMRGPGETKLELDKRKVRDKINKLTEEIEKIKGQRQVKRQQRQESSKFKVAIVGYTNAGKSTFLNTLAKENIYADDKLFATLETTTRQVFLSYDCQIVLTDTVGFISNLPHSLVDAFASTLEEAKDADVIIHLVDGSNQHYKEQVEVVEKVLEDLKVNSPIITVYNKCDKILEREEDKIYISAKNKTGIEDLKQKLIETCLSLKG
ncbi:MAG: GTPase HflX [Clostridia bacterium]|nr:GTPase HflX [Clostridia bacterium]